MKALDTKQKQLFSEDQKLDVQLSHEARMQRAKLAFENESEPLFQKIFEIREVKFEELQLESISSDEDVAPMSQSHALNQKERMILVPVNKKVQELEDQELFENMIKSIKAKSDTLLDTVPSP